MAGQKRKAELSEQEIEAEARKQEIIAKVQTLDADQTLEYLGELCERWKLQFPGRSYEDVLTTAFENFKVSITGHIDGMDMGNFGMRELDAVIHTHEMEAIAMYHHLRSHKLIGIPGDDEAEEDNQGAGAETLNRILKVLEMVYYSKRIVLSAFQANLALHQVHCADLKLEKDIDARLGSWSLRFRWIDDNMNELQQLLLYLLDNAFEKQLRKQDGYVFEPILVQGHNTHAFRCLCEIKDWVYSVTQKELQFQQWTNLTHGNNTIKSVVEYLSGCKDYQFPNLIKDRTVFAFRNGVYLANEDRFYEYGSAEPLAESIVACKFFDANFELYEEIRDWRLIPTYAFQSILDHQEIPEEACQWMYVFIGRMMYDLNTFDGWQVIPFIKGHAGTGKCFRIGSQVLLADGQTIAVEHVQVGHQLMGDDGTPREVLSLAVGIEPLFEIYCTTTAELVLAVTGHHILCLLDVSKGYAVVEMTVLEYVGLPGDRQKELLLYRPNKPMCFPASYQNVSAQTARLVGSWLGTGVSHSLALAATTANSGFREAMERCGVLEAKRIPAAFMTASVTVRQQLLMGFFDVDGWTMSGHRELYVESPELADDVMFVARSLGLHIEREGTVLKIYYMCQFGYAFTVHPLNPNRREPYVGFEVNGNKRFLMADWTVTHNSTICTHVVRNLYDPIDVGVMSNNIERKFGISAFWDKNVFIGPECRNDLAIEQAEFQSIVSGEDIQVNMKHKKAFSTQWRVPGILAGNEVPSWADAAGSVQRRLAVYDFEKPVLQGDMRLGEKIDNEMPDLLVKCNRAYREMAARHGSDNIWTLLGPYFHKTSSELAQTINVLEAFLACDEVVFGAGKYVPFDEFKNAVSAYAQINGFTKPKFHVDYFRGPFTKRGITKEKGTKTWNGRVLNREFLIGVDLVRDETVNLL